MTTISAGFQFRLTGVTSDPFDTRTRQNVKKQYAKIVYLEEPTSDAVKLSYVGSEEINPRDNLFIGDRSDSLYANSKTSTVEEFISTSTSGTVDVASVNFLVTQEFVEADSGYIPLYFKHNITSYVIPESIKVFDQNYNMVGTDKWKLVPQYNYNEDTGAVLSTVSQYNLFNSLENSFNPSTGIYTVYFVQYTYVSGSSEITVTEILDNEEAYKPAEAEDFWHLTPGQLKPWAYVYYRDEYSVTLPTISKFAIKYIESERVSVKHSVDLTDTEPWFPRVVNGSFNHGYAGYTSTYSIPEFENQAFSPIEPYKIAARKLCEKIDKRLLQLPHEDIQTGSTFTHLSVVFEKDEVAEYAITTDSSLNGTPYFDFDGHRVYDSDGDEITWSTSHLLGFDRRSGIVYTDFDISDYHKIYATYPYKEKHYTFTGMMMNPIFDRNVHKQTRVIYMVPVNDANENSSTQTAALMWLKASRADVILSTNQDGTSGNEDVNFDTRVTDSDGYSIQGALGLHYSWSASTTASAQSPATVVEILPGERFYVQSTSSFPKEGWLRALDVSGNYRYFKYDSKTDTYFTLSTSSSEVPTDGLINVPDGNAVELVNFIQERTTLSDRSSSDEVSYFGGTGLPSVFSQYFVLAEMSVNPPHGKQDLTVIDVREDGGGIDEDKYDEAKALNPQVQWMNDYHSFDGQVYPSNAVIVIKLPKTVLNDFSLDNLRQIISEKVPYGIYPLIRFYGYEPRIISILPTTTVGAIEVKWEKEGSEFVYDIWYAHNEKGPWTRANDYLLTDGSGSYNSFTIEGLTDESPYLVKITMQDRYYSWWYGYNGHNSIAGGLGLDEDPPDAPFGNIANFQFRVL